MSALASPGTEGVHGVHPKAPTTLRAVMDSRRRLSLDDAIAVVVSVSVDLAERHARGEARYVHPSAIASGPDGLMRLDPALALFPTDARDRAALAPEVLRSNEPGDARASVFAVGAMLYEAVCGMPVGPGMRRPREVDPSLPAALEHLLAKALIADPSHRPGDLGALASAMHHIAPMKSIPPPDADTSAIDFEVDIRLSIMPPEHAPGDDAPPPSPPQVVMLDPTGRPGLTNGAAQAAAAQAIARDPTRQLATLKARLESDPRPRYVVNKDRMDHGPFNAVELLQQIASHTFVGKDTLRDDLTGDAKAIDAWEEFAPFAEHARMHRDIAHEKREVAKVEKAEKTAGAAKFIVGGVMAVALLAIGGFFVIKEVGSRKDGGEISDDPSAVDLSGGGSLKGGKKATAGARKGGGGGGAGFVGGMSYEQARASYNQEITMGGKGVPDLTNAQLEAPMKSVSFISGCGAPEGMRVTVKVAVKDGRAVGVSVSTNPSNATVAACVDRHVRALSWPRNAKMDFLTTSY